MQSKQQEKRRLRIGAWNVRTLLQAGKLENLKEEMRRNKVDVMGISDRSEVENKVMNYLEYCIPEVILKEVIVSG